MIALRIAVSVVCVVTIVRTVLSAVRTFVVPRDEAVALSRLLFRLSRSMFTFLASRQRDDKALHRIMRLYAPLTLLTLPGAWLLLVFASFAGVFWALDATSWRDAVDLSGSSLFTLGFAHPSGFGMRLLVFAEAILGFGLLTLLITYLPTIYDAYQRRERQVALLEVRAGAPPSAVEMLRRFQIIGMLGDTAELWGDWEKWFVDLEESHVSMGALALFRSGRANQSWVTAAGTVLDGAALLLSAVDVPYEPRAALCVRSGFLALREIADYYDIDHDPNPGPSDPISIERGEFDRVLDQLAQTGVPLHADRDAAWRDFAGWRVNYDTVLLALAALTDAPSAPWTSDRGLAYSAPPVTRRGGRGRGARR